MSRIRILALFATLAALTVVFAACGGGSDSSSEDPQKVVEEASLEGVKSGELDLSMHVNAEGEEGGEVDVNLSGPFEAGTEGELPQLEMTAEAEGTAQGEDINFEGKLTLLTDRGFVEYEGTAYEVDPTSFGFPRGLAGRSKYSRDPIPATGVAGRGTSAGLPRGVSQSR